jgi:hypothetical protein
VVIVILWVSNRLEQAAVADCAGCEAAWL